WREPYHAIPMLPGVALCTVVMLAEEVSARDRCVAAVALAVFLVSRAIGRPFEMRGWLLLLRFMVLVAALTFLLPCLRRAACVILPGGDAASNDSSASPEART